MMSELERKVTEIHDSLFDPDEGIYSRIRSVQDAVTSLDHRMTVEQINIRNNIAELQAFRKNVRSGSYWTLGTLLTAAIGIVGTLIVGQ